MSNKYSLSREHNYTILITDRNKKSLSFRDITGEDLEYLERFFQEGKTLSMEEIISILELINVSKTQINKLTLRVIKEIFDIVTEEILCNYMPKFKWLEVCYALQNNSFVALKFLQLLK
jgi:cyanate lyase